MGAGCSTRTNIHEVNRGRPMHQSSLRLITGALGELANGIILPNEPATTQPHVQQHNNENNVPPLTPSQPGTPNYLDTTPLPSPARTPLPHVLTPGVQIVPIDDKPLLGQRQTIPPPTLDLDNSTGIPRIPSNESTRGLDGDNSTKSIPWVRTSRDQAFAMHDYEYETPSTNDQNNQNEQNEEEKEKENEQENEQNEEEEENKDYEDEPTDGMSQANSEDPLTLVPPLDNNRRRNSISVLPSIDPKPKMLGCSTSEDKKTDPDLVLWIANKLKTKLKLARISKAYDRFIPSNFYAEMGKQDIREVDLGECVIIRKSILFCDIRNFTAFSSKIGPQDTFKFINAFSRRLLPVVRKHGGYIDKFIGDALVALFPSPVSGILAGNDILRVLEEYNLVRYAKALTPVRVGIGCHTGTLMLGTVGDNQRMDGIAIGNVISLASQLFGVDFVVTQVTMLGLKDEDKANLIFRRLGRIKEGTDDDQLTDIFQVLTAKSTVSGIVDKFADGVREFEQQNFSEAAEAFHQCLEKLPNDKPCLVLENRAQHFLACTYLPSDWRNALTYHTEFMTQSTPTSVLTQPAPGFPSVSTGGGTSHLSLMRLVFSAIFHMQKKNESGDGEDGASEESLSVKVPTDTRCALPPISSAKSLSHTNGSSPKSDAHVSIPSSPGSPPAATTPEKNKERELITLVLSGFENHNRVSYLTKAYQRFVPNDFFAYLGKDDIQHVDIGDSMMTNITTMFIEIHGFQPKSQMVSEKTYNQLQGMKRFSDPSPPSHNSRTPLQTIPSSQPPSESPSKHKLGRMASRSTVNMRADLFSFQFINTISQKLLPIIRQCDGYVDKFFGNAILALFPNLDAATSAGLQIMSVVKSFGNAEDEDGHPPYAQIGMNSGNVILGTVGDGKRMDGTVIGNTVNVAARMLSLTKIYSTKFVTTQKCISQLGQSSSPPSTFPPSPPSFSAASLASSPLPPISSVPQSSPPKTQLPPFSAEPCTQPRQPGTYKFYNQRVLDTVRVPGKEEAIIIHEIFDNESQVAQIKKTYEVGLALYQARNFAAALKRFEEALEVYPADVPSQMLRDKCSQCLRDGVPVDWDGVTVVVVK